MRRVKYISIPAVYRQAVVHPSRSREDVVRSVASETWDQLTEIYRSFVTWSSAYGDENVDYQQEPKQRREQVSRGLSGFSNYYSPRSVWFERQTCKAIEKFIETCEALRSEFVDEISKRGYSRRVRANMAERASTELGPLRKEALSNLQQELRKSYKPKL
jgi:hypothetical protein